MRLLLDENLSPALASFLTEADHDVVHVRDRGLASATDEVVLTLAADESRVLITEPSVVLIRRAVGRRAAEQASLLIDNLPVAKDDLEDGAVVVLGEKTIRIRRLPI